ncbi:MAG: hypothetical protein WB383_05365 [Acidimicrobiales bacterium]
MKARDVPPLTESERTGGFGDVEHATRDRARDALGEVDVEGDYDDPGIVTTP